MVVDQLEPIPEMIGFEAVEKEADRVRFLDEVDLDRSTVLTDLGGPEVVELSSCLADKISASELVHVADLSALVYVSLEVDSKGFDVVVALRGIVLLENPEAVAVVLMVGFMHPGWFELVLGMKYIELEGSACMVELDWLSTVADLGSAAAAIHVEVLTLIVGVGNGLVMAMDPRGQEVEIDSGRLVLIHPEVLPIVVDSF